MGDPYRGSVTGLPRFSVTVDGEHLTGDRFADIIEAMRLRGYSSKHLTEVAGALIERSRGAVIETCRVGHGPRHRSKPAVVSEPAGARPSVGWSAVQRWRDDGDDVVPDWCVEGPGPFDGVRCRDEDQAEAVAAWLNAATGRQPRAPARVHSEPHPVARSLADEVTALAGDRLNIQVTGSTITITEGT